jgi:hypothetical protein
MHTTENSIIDTIAKSLEAATGANNISWLNAKCL